MEQDSDRRLRVMRQVNEQCGSRDMRMAIVSRDGLRVIEYVAGERGYAHAL